MIDKLPLTDDELARCAVEYQAAASTVGDAADVALANWATDWAERLLSDVSRLQTILSKLPPRDVIAAAAKAGIRLRHPDVPESTK